MILSFNFLNQMTLNEIKKYNGKSVEIQNLINCLTNSNDILLFFKFPSTSASKETKFRSLLKLKSISFKKVKKKHYLLALNLIKTRANLNSIDIEHLIKLFDGNVFLLIFPNFNYLVYFYKNFNFMFFKEKTNFLFVKFVNQYFFTDSIEYIALEKKVRTGELTPSSNFFFLSNIISGHFLLFIIYFIFQQKFYTLF